MATHSRRPERVAQLTGRSSELSVLDRLIDAVRAGQSRVLVVSGEPGAGKTALLDYLAGRADGCRVERAAGVESEMELAFMPVSASAVRGCGGTGPARPAARAPAGGAADRVRPERGPGSGSFPGRPGRAGPAVGGGRTAAAGVRGGRRTVAGPGLGAGAGVRRPAAGRRPGGPGVRSPGSRCGSAWIAPADGRGTAGTRRACAAGLGAGRASGRAGAGPVRGRDARKSAGAAGAVPGGDAGRAGRRVRPTGCTARCGIARGANRGEFRAADPGPGPRQQTLAAAGGGRPVRRLPAGMAGRREARDPAPGVDTGGRGFGGLASSSALRCGSGIRWYVPRPTSQHRCRTARKCTARWPKPPIHWPIRIAGPGTGPRPRPGQTRTSPRNSRARRGGPRPGAGSAAAASHFWLRAGHR